MRRNKVEVRSDCVIFPPAVLIDGLARLGGFDPGQLAAAIAHLEAEVGAHHQYLIAERPPTDVNTVREMSRAPESTR